MAGRQGWQALAAGSGRAGGDGASSQTAGAGWRRAPEVVGTARGGGHSQRWWAQPAAADVAAISWGLASPIHLSTHRVVCHKEVQLVQVPAGGAGPRQANGGQQPLCNWAGAQHSAVPALQCSAGHTLKLAPPPPHTHTSPPPVTCRRTAPACRPTGSRSAAPRRRAAGTAAGSCC